MDCLDKRRRAFLAAAGLCCALSMAGCSTVLPRPGPGVEPGGQYALLTTPIVAIGDSQEHESSGYPLHDNDSAVDAFFEFTQRPPEQPLFGRRILEWALQSHPNEPFLHLGDVLDMSCRSELQRIRQIFFSAGRPGAILPGNHDGLMFGIYGYNVLEAALDSGAEKWNRACSRGAAPDDPMHRTANEALSKRDFLATYISALAAAQPASAALPIPPARGAARISWRNPDPLAYVSGIEAQLLDGYSYADSYIAHRLRLPRAPGATRDVVVIGLDTNQAGLLVSAWDTLRGRSPGDTGHVRRDQVAAVTRWVLEASRNGDVVVFAGHHDWRSLGLPTRNLLRNLMSNVAHPLVYLSAHTHSGFWALHTELDRRPLLEMNVSSLSDWPISYRRISFAIDEQTNRLQVRSELMPRRAQPSESDADLMAAWEAETCEQLGSIFDKVRAYDRDLVRRQRESRGSVMGWLLQWLSPVCEVCEAPMYEHAQSYLDAMLDALLQVGEHLHAETTQLYLLTAPKWCRGDSFDDCVRSLKAEAATDSRAQVDLFRRKAQLVDLLNNHLDALRSPQARAYMTCRAVLAAKIDFDSTDEERKGERSEARRRADQFFRIEASVGID